jgi:hypothetical protein
MIILVPARFYVEYAGYSRETPHQPSAMQMNQPAHVCANSLRVCVDHMSAMHAMHESYISVIPCGVDAFCRPLSYSCCRTPCRVHQQSACFGSTGHASNPMLGLLRGKIAARIKGKWSGQSQLVRRFRGASTPSDRPTWLGRFNISTSIYISLSWYGGRRSMCHYSEVPTT